MKKMFITLGIAFALVCGFMLTNNSHTYDTQVYTTDEIVMVNDK